MKGLLQKDLYMTWKYGRTLLIMAVLFLLFGTLSKEDNFFFVVYPVLFAGVLPTTLLSYDERFGWMRTCGTLPLSRKTMVSERYVMTLLSFLALYVLTLLAQAVKLFPRGEVGAVLELGAMLPFFGLLSPSVMLPVTFRWGMEKARIVYYFIIGMVCALGVIVLPRMESLDAEIGRSASLGILLVAVLLFGLSWLLSIRLYEKKEL